MLHNESCVNGESSMPPKFKYTREQIVECAVSIVRETGMDGVTARELGKRLGVSVKPIFTAFTNMDEVKSAVFERVLQIYHASAEECAGEMPSFKRSGMQVIRFAKKEPMLFRLLFMQPCPGRSFGQAMEDLLKGDDQTIRGLMEVHGLSREDAGRLFELIWVQTYGIASHIALGLCDFKEEEISQMLSIAFVGILTALKSGAADAYLEELRGRQERKE